MSNEVGPTTAWPSPSTTLRLKNVVNCRGVYNDVTFMSGNVIAVAKTTADLVCADAHGILHPTQGSTLMSLVELLYHIAPLPEPVSETVF